MGKKEKPQSSEDPNITIGKIINFLTKKEFRPEINNLTPESRVIHNASFYLLTPSGSTEKFWWGDADSQRLQIFQEVAKELNVAIVATTEEFYREFKRGPNMLGGHILPAKFRPTEKQEKSPPLREALLHAEALFLPNQEFILFHNWDTRKFGLEHKTLKPGSIDYQLGPDIQYAAMEKGEGKTLKFLLGLLKNANIKVPKQKLISSTDVFLFLERDQKEEEERLIAQHRFKPPGARNQN